MNSILDFKKDGKKITMLTCYDYWSARLLNDSPVDCILVGDSGAMVMHGYPDTVAATCELMALHTRAVKLGAPDRFVIGDMPFLSFRGSLDHAQEQPTRRIRLTAPLLPVAKGRCRYSKTTLEVLCRASDLFADGPHTFGWHWINLDHFQSHIPALPGGNFVQAFQQSHAKFRFRFRFLHRLAP